MSNAGTERIRVLHVDDDPDFLELSAAFLEREGLTVETTTGIADAHDLVDSGNFDCVVSDYEMPERTGIEFLEAVRADHPNLPFILFTGKGSEEVASDAISAGVTDYLQKEAGTHQFAVLANRITNAVEHDRSRRLVEESERRLREIVNSLPHALYIVSADGRYLLANEQLAEFHGTTVDDLEGSTLGDVLSADALEFFESSIQETLDADSVCHYSGVGVEGADGEERVFEPRLRPFTFEGERAVLGIAADVTERENQARALERSQERIELALSHTESVVFDIDLDTDEVTRHGSYERSFGEHPDDAPTWRAHCERVVHPDDREQFRDLHRRLIDGEIDGGDIEYRTTPDHGGRWVHARLQVPDDEGPRRAVGISQDVTERKEHERELERANALLSRLFDTLPVGVLAEDEDRTVLTANQQLVDLLGFDASADDLVGVDCERLLGDASDQFAHPDEFEARVADLVATGDPVRDESLALADGRTFTRSYQPVDLGDGAGHLWLYRDVTDRAEHEDRLESLNETLRALMSAESREEVARLGVEAGADVLRLDANAIHLYDSERDALVPVAATDTLHDLIGDPPAFTPGDSIAWRVFDSGSPAVLNDVHADPDLYNPDTPVRSELVLPVGDVGVLLAGSTSAAAFDSEDRVLGEILAGNVATALEQVSRTAELRERERELTRQNERLAEFASVVSHDLRSPLTVAKGRVDLAREDADTDDLDAAAGALDRMDDLITDLLLLARGGDEPTLEPVDLPVVVRACWGHVETEDATLRVQTDRRVLADRSRLQQLLENLIGNCVEHGSTTPRSQTHEDCVEHGSTNPPSQARGDCAEHSGSDVTVTVGDLDDGFYVADDGPGIPEEEREDVFELGHSTSNTGAGFGLSIVRTVADAHGWTVTVTESEDGGARFEIRGVERA